MSTAAATCLHCLTPLDGAGSGPFCCTGCRVVYGLLHAEGLDRFYELRGRSGGRAIADTPAERRDHKWLEAFSERLRAADGVCRVDLDVQGLHCSGCVWLIDTLFRRHAGAHGILVNPALGRLHLTAARDFELGSFVDEVERFGYLLGPPLKSERSRESNGLLARMGICIAIAMNSMIFAISIYAGLREGPLFDLFQRLNLVLSFVSVAVGGSVFMAGAWRGLQRRVLHLDLPIALGILLAFAGSVHSYVVRRGDASFVDTLNVFIALMLVGRWLQQRVLERNRLALLASDGVDGLLTRRAENGKVATVKCTEVRAGDTLVVAPGDLVPVDAKLVDDLPASFSLDWINGESRARAFRDGERVPAGAFSAGARAVELRAETDFSASPLIDLLRTPTLREQTAAAALPWWQRFTKIYVAIVLVAAALGFAAWFVATRDAARSAEIATAVLIVTCPCAFGIAMPLANDLVQAGLRRAGLFVRSQGFLDRAAAVKKVVFDKTGTITSGAPKLADPTVIDALSVVERAALYAMASRSGHPKSIAVKHALELRGEATGATASDAVSEHAGLGLELERDGVRYRLGAPTWAAPGLTARGDVVFAAAPTNDKGAVSVLADLATVEEFRPDAAREAKALRARAYEVWLLSGDAEDRVARAARECGIAESCAVGAKSAVAKAAWVAAHDAHDLLMIGDGINDSLVLEQAHCSGTPAVDRPFMAARSDFYFVSPGLRPIRLALDASRALSDVRRRNLCIAVAYNAVAVALAYAGVMSPLVCAVLMPISSLTTIAATTLSLSPRSALWKS